MKVIAFAASNSRNSINKKLVQHAANLLKSQVVETAEIEILDLNDYDAPIFSVDTESESGIPDSATAFFKKLESCDAILVSYAEHNGLYSAVWKSLFDWMSRIDRKVFHDKPMVVLATSPGGGGAANVLRIANDSASHFGANIQASLSVPSFNDNFDVESGELSNAELAAQLLTALEKLKTD
jgi:NAD(P)H-dependent FMN reductase